MGFGGQCGPTFGHYPNAQAALSLARSKGGNLICLFVFSSELIWGWGISTLELAIFYSKD